MNLWNFLYPSICLNCEKGNDWLCDDCLNFVYFTKSQICPGCHKLSQNGKRCKSCSSRIKLNQLCVSAYYRGILKKIIPEAKYKYKQIMGQVAGRWLADTARRSINVKSAIIVPVPADPKRFGELGYHFSHILAKKASHELKLPYQDILKKKISTPKQVGQNRKTRIKQLDNNIFLKKQIHKKTVILVDDIFTTGATLNECAKVIKQSYPSVKVIGLAICRG